MAAPLDRDASMRWLLEEQTQRPSEKEIEVRSALASVLDELDAQASERQCHG